MQLLEPTEHELDPVAVLVVLDWPAAQLFARDAGLYPVVFRTISELLRVVPRSARSHCAFGKLPQRAAPADLDLACNYKEPDWAFLSIFDRLQFDRHAALGSVDQTAPPAPRLPFLPEGSLPSVGSFPNAAAATSRGSWGSNPSVTTISCLRMARFVRLYHAAMQIVGSLTNPVPATKLHKYIK